MGTYIGKCQYCGKEVNIIPLRDETCNMILHIGQMVVEGKIQQARISVDGTVVTIKGGEKIKITRSLKYEQGKNI